MALNVRLTYGCDVRRRKLCLVNRAVRFFLPLGVNYYYVVYVVLFFWEALYLSIFHLGTHTPTALNKNVSGGGSHEVQRFLFCFDFPLFCVCWLLVMAVVEQYIFVAFCRRLHAYNYDAVRLGYHSRMMLN